MYHSHKLIKELAACMNRYFTDAMGGNLVGRQRYDSKHFFSLSKCLKLQKVIYYAMS